MYANIFPFIFSTFFLCLYERVDFVELILFSFFLCQSFYSPFTMLLNSNVISRVAFVPFFVLLLSLKYKNVHRIHTHAHIKNVIRAFTIIRLFKWQSADLYAHTHGRREIERASNNIQIHAFVWQN